MQPRPQFSHLLVRTGVALLLSALGCSSSQPAKRTVHRIQEAGGLQALLARPLESAEIHLAPGVYHLEPTRAVEPRCGNCEDPDTPVELSYGVRVSGKNVHIRGPEGQRAIIHTHAGYGILFMECQGCSISGVEVTDGVRDPDSNATDGAIVVGKSSVTISDVRIFDNIGEAEVLATTVVGIAGIVGREGATMAIENNRITRSSWDGVALYRGAEARISGNVIDGVDKARGMDAGGGRGVGIGVTWDAKAVIENNLVKRYWKGIGIFVDGSAVVRKNVIEDVLTWGLAYWDADKGAPVALIEDNVVYRTGACGASVQAGASAAPGRLRGNVIVETGRNPKYDSEDAYCYQRPLAVHAAPEGFTIADNVLHANRRAADQAAAPDEDDDDDVSRDELMQRAGPLLDELARRPALREAVFWRAFGEGERTGEE